MTCSGDDVISKCFLEGIKVFAVATGLALLLLLWVRLSVKLEKRYGSDLGFLFSLISFFHVIALYIVLVNCLIGGT